MKLSLLVQAWRDEAEDISTGKHATNNRRRKSALIMCANQLEAALAASGTLTDEQIEAEANQPSRWEDPFAGAARAYAMGAKWARSQITAPGALTDEDVAAWAKAEYPLWEQEGGDEYALAAILNFWRWARSQIAASGSEPKALDLADTFAPHDAERIAAYQRANAAPGAKALDLADRLVAERGCSHHALDVQAAAALRAAYGYSHTERITMTEISMPQYRSHKTTLARET